ncbi:MAG: Cna B-type domain-containing protein, partial [Oscillospiraceae bacterium]|nr:Cna B-type domain-containing protein [Oscillospiraceae bacterium]
YLTINDADNKYQTIKEEVSVELLINGTANTTGYFLIDEKQAVLNFDSNGYATYVWNGIVGQNYYKQIIIKEQKINESGEWIDLEWYDTRKYQGASVQNASYEKVTSFSAAKINLTVPDETALKITYSYKLSKDGIDLGTRLNGVAWGGNDIFTASNSISLNTGNAQATDSTDDKSFIVNSTAATVTTGDMPQIVKYDINDYSLQLNAGFLIAKYDGDNKWNFATEDQLQKYDNRTWVDIDEKDVQSTDNIRHSLTFDAVAEGNQVPDGAITININGEPYKVDLNDGDFYKVIEIVPPDGYEGSNLTFTDEYPDLKSLLIAYAQNPDSFKDSGYYNFLKNFVSTHYIEYGTKKLSQYPDGVTSANLIKVNTGGSANIYNNQLINVKSEKTWDREDHFKAKVKVELLWSYTKSPTGIPADAKQANAESLGLLDSSFSYEKEILSNESAIWEDLPSGINGRPIYYYVKEIGYTLDYTTGNAGWYNLQSDGTYKNAVGEIGSYKPIYIGNALNKGDKDSDDSTGTVSINNTEGLTVKKLWVYSNGTPMEAESIPLDKITYKLYGITQNSQQVELYTGTLTPDGNWKEVVPSNYLSNEYVSYKVEEYLEDLTAEEKLNLYGYKISCTGVSNGTAGEFTITNKNNTPSEIEVNVEKEWADGNDLHQFDSIKIKLYKSSRSLSDKEIEALSKGTLPSDNTVSAVENGEVTLYAGNQWKNTWSNLAYKDENVSRYFYYPVEIDMTVSDSSKQYTPSYARVDKAATQSVKIRNTVPGGLTVNKSWVNDKGEEITNGLPEKIVVELYKRLQSSSDDSSDNTPATKDTVKIMSMGDSITHGYINGDNGYRKYLYHQLVDNKGYVIDMVGSNNTGWTPSYNFSDGTYSYDPQHEGYSGYTIKSYGGRTGLLDTIKNNNTVENNAPDIVILMIGTNDILDTYDIPNIGSRLEELVDFIYSQKSDVKLIIMSPPPIDSSIESWVPDQTTVNASLSTCKTAVQNLVKTKQAEGKSCEFVDINKLFNDQADYTVYLNDYCHPNESGYELMGNYLATVVDNYLKTGSVEVGGSSGTSTNAPVNIDDCPTDLTEAEKVGEYTITPDEHGNWSLTISDLEKSDG